MVTAYLPGSSRSRGKLYWPCALLTTVTVIVEPARLALTSTPSIAPSSCELTLPERAAAACVWATAGKARGMAADNRAMVRTDERVPRARLVILKSSRCVSTARDDQGLRSRITPLVGTHKGGNGPDRPPSPALIRPKVAVLSCAQADDRSIGRSLS